MTDQHPLNPDHTEQLRRRAHQQHMRGHLRDMALYLGVPLALLGQIDSLTDEQKRALLACMEADRG